MGIETILLNAIGPIIGGFLALIGAFVVYYLTNKANERRFWRQLNHDDRKSSLRRLHDLLDAKAEKPYEWANKVTAFVNSFDGTFLPPELRRAVLDQMHAVQSAVEKVHPEYGFDEEDYFEDQAALYGVLTDEEEAELDIDERVTAAKGDLMQKSRTLALGLDAPSRLSRILRRIRARFKRTPKLPKATNTARPEGVRKKWLRIPGRAKKKREDHATIGAAVTLIL